MTKIKLSKFAAEVLHLTIKLSEIPSDKGLRLEKCEDGLTLTVDSPKKGDRLVKKDGSILLIFNTKFENQIGEATIDIGDIRKNPKLIIIRHGIVK